jgi:hypothetical protein
VADKRGFVMTTLLELEDDEWIVWNGCEIERIGIIEALEWAMDLFGFSLLSQYTKMSQYIDMTEK